MAANRAKNARKRSNLKESLSHYDKVIGANLRLLRGARNLSQATIASDLGITFQQVQKYERGENRISAATLVFLSQLLEVNVIDLFQGIAGVIKPKTLRLKNTIDALEGAKFLSARLKGSDENAFRHILKVITDGAIADGVDRSTLVLVLLRASQQVSLRSAKALEQESGAHKERGRYRKAVPNRAA